MSAISVLSVFNYIYVLCSCSGSFTLQIRFCITDIKDWSAILDHIEPFLQDVFDLDIIEVAAAKGDIFLD